RSGFSGKAHLPGLGRSGNGRAGSVGLRNPGTRGPASLSFALSDDVHDRTRFFHPSPRSGSVVAHSGVGTMKALILFFISAPALGAAQTWAAEQVSRKSYLIAAEANSVPAGISPVASLRWACELEQEHRGSLKSCFKLLQ